jgi:hypothetical protein
MKNNFNAVFMRIVRSNENASLKIYKRSETRISCLERSECRNVREC